MPYSQTSREGTEDLFVSFKDELAWKFRSWVAQGDYKPTTRRRGSRVEKIKYSECPVGFN